MCQIGDIILVQKYKYHGLDLPRHSFIVISDENGEIQGVSYDFIANVLSSFKNDMQRKRKLKYPGNFPIDSDDTETNPHNNKSGFVKADQLYYFAKDKLSYTVIGTMKPDVFNELMNFIENSDFDFEDIIDNL